MMIKINLQKNTVGIFPTHLPQQNNDKFRMKTGPSGLTLPMWLSGMSTHFLLILPPKHLPIANSNSPLFLFFNNSLEEKQQSVKHDGDSRIGVSF